MKILKIIGLSVLSASVMVLSGCGGGSSSGYDMWDYIVPSSDINIIYDDYELDRNGTIIRSEIGTSYKNFDVISDSNVTAKYSDNTPSAPPAKNPSITKI